METTETEGVVDSLETKIEYKRSILLTVICILTWVACLYSICISLLMISNTIISTEIKNKFGDGTLWFLYNAFIAPLLCAVGSILMFLLKKWGFWIYLAGQLVPIFYTIYTTMSLTGSLGSGMMFGILSQMIPIAFIIMYAMEVRKFSKKTVSIDF